jgi:hypothetical protein
MGMSVQVAMESKNEHDIRRDGSKCSKNNQGDGIKIRPLVSGYVQYVVVVVVVVVSVGQGIVAYHLA